LTYAELDTAANRVVNSVLADRGTGQEVVALLVGVDVLAVTAALGVLKTGKIYVALEPSFPDRRNTAILEDTDAGLILADRRHLAQAQALAGSQRRVIQLETLAGGDPGPPNVRVPLDSWAILNYTSGSTGSPKGVVQSHFSAYAHAVRKWATLHMSDVDGLAFSTSLAWSSTYGHMFGPLCLGARTAAFDIRQHGLRQLLAWLQETEPTILPARNLLRQIVSTDLAQEFPSVRVATLSGDAILREDVQACMRLFPNALVSVRLGLTEAGHVTELLIDSPEMLQWEVMPVGFPMPGLHIKLLGDDGQEVEPGNAGEIVILDRTLAEGYWRRPQLTASRFRTIDSLGSEPAFLTGDLGRQTPDGLLHHMGRKDFMVKIRGYQVFTNEIEAILLGVEGVKEACVMAHDVPQGSRRLAAYLVVDRDAFPGAAALHARFEDIPRHMAPQAYLFLDGLPRIPTGKVDRGHLPLPARSRLSATAEYVAARDPTEKVLARIWQSVLGIDDLGVRDSFLELGGHSLDSMRIVSRVAAVFHVDIPLSDFFGVLTIAEMANLVRSARQGSRAEAT
jgi:acyl-coenzyme A synthetase/AMP-(fatty) acid ligase/acyl carrier protein